MWFPYVQFTGGLPSFLGRIPETVWHPSHLSSLSLTISFITIFVLLIPSPHSYVGLQALWLPDPLLCSSHSLESLLPSSLSSVLCVFLPKFRLLTSPSLVEMPLLWILYILYHVTLCTTALWSAFPVKKTASFMKTPAMSAHALSGSQRLEQNLVHDGHPLHI